MDYGMQTMQVDATVLNQNFVELLDQGQTKQAADAGTVLVRAIVRQAAAVRQILTAIPIGPNDLDPWPTSDHPVKFMDVEPNSVATSVQFYGTPKTRYYTMGKVPVMFGMLQSDEFVKNKFELMTYRTDVRKLFADNSVNDLADQEDVMFRRDCVRAVNKNPSVQRTDLARITATGWGLGLSAVYDRRIPVGKALMSKSRLVDMIDLPATAVGDSVAAGSFKEGINKLDGIWGVPVVSTMKSDIYMRNEAWLFPPENFMGKFWTLQDATLYVEQRGVIVKFYVYSAIGMGLANVLGIQQYAFGPTTPSN